MATRYPRTGDPAQARHKSPLAAALKYLEIYFSGQEFERLTPLLTSDCSFHGPFFSFSTAADYINSLTGDPPLNCTFCIVKTFEEEHFANIIYEFSKPGVTCQILQMFEKRNDKIAGIV